MTRLNKRAAKKAYQNGATIFIVPHKVSPHNIYGIGTEYRQADFFPCVEGDRTYRDFDYLVDNITYYNCNSALGTYLAYYIKEVTA